MVITFSKNKTTNSQTIVISRNTTINTFSISHESDIRTECIAVISIYGQCKDALEQKKKILNRMTERITKGKERGFLRRKNRITFLQSKTGS